MEQPTPGLLNRRRSLVASVDRLEESAERMSNGSDIGEEIRKVWQDQKRQDSQRSSLRNSPTPSSYRVPSRQRSGSSLSNSTDVNGHAYRSTHPSAGPIVSPSPSVKSSRSDTRQRASSTSKSAARSPQAVWGPPTLQQQFSNGSMDGGFTTVRSPDTHHFISQPSDGISTSQRPLPPISESARYHQPQRSAQPISSHKWVPRNSYDDEAESSAMLSAPTHQTSVARSASNTSQSTMQKARSLFRDFDGIHYSPVAEHPREGYVGHSDEEVDEDDQVENDEYRISQPGHGAEPEGEGRPRTPAEEIQALSDELGLDIDFGKNKNDGEDEDGGKIHERVEILPAVQSGLRWAEPPPAQSMVYYPAPVPMNLNMPKRLSLLPGLSTSAMRRSQVMGSMPLETRQSAMWMQGPSGPGPPPEAASGAPETDAVDQQKHRQSVLEFQRLPPQLRASVFFDQKPVPHQVELKNGSAIATLDSLLDASARAPAKHSPQDLDLSGDSMPNGHKRGKGSVLSNLIDSKSEASKSRLSLLPFKRRSSGNVLRQRQTSSEAIADDEAADSQPDDDEEAERSGLLGESENEEREIPLYDAYLEATHELDADQKRGMPSLEEQYSGAPTTLLAELQLRKQQLRSRNRTAITAFPQGMHATLLELDAVEQVEKKRRQGKKTALAWDPPTIGNANGEGNDDEDVPLGVLYPSKNGSAQRNGVSDWDRPLGLLEKRHYEDNEPLSRRRNRLRGVDPNQVVPSPPAPVEQEVQSEHEDETLAQRLRRLKSSKALDDALEKSNVDGFASDLTSQLGALDGNTKPAGREAFPRSRAPDGKGYSGTGSSSNLANILAAAPAEHNRKISNEATLRVMVGQSEEARAQQRKSLPLSDQVSFSNLLETRHTEPPQMQYSQGAVGQYVRNGTQRSVTLGIGTQQQADRVVPPGGLLGYADLSQQQRRSQLNQHSQHGYSNPTANYPLDVPGSQLYTSNHAVGGTFHDGAGPMQASAMAQMNPYGSTQNLGQPMLPQHPMQSPYAFYPQSRNSTMSAYGMPLMYTAQGMPMHPGLLQDPDGLPMTPKQRENIDRWRQSIMYP